jgi:hypothetical protein
VQNHIKSHFVAILISILLLMSCHESAAASNISNVEPLADTIYTQSLVYQLEQKLRTCLEPLDEWIRTMEKEISDIGSDHVTNGTIVNRTKMQTLKGKMFAAKESRNTFIDEQDIIIARAIMDELWSLDKYKNDKNFIEDLQICEYVRKLYLLLSTHGRLNARYVKLPRDWMNLGYDCGLLEDLVVVTRTLGQLGICKSHMVKSEDLIQGFKDYTTREGYTAPNSINRFAFLGDLFSRVADSATVQNKLSRAILSQGASKRIGIYQTKPDVIHNGVVSYPQTFYYAIQGLYNLEFDPKVTTSIQSSDFYKEVCTVPLYAIHFTRADIALSIFTNAPTTSYRKRPNGKDLVPGAICRFDRVIHAITDISKIEHQDDATPDFPIANVILLLAKNSKTFAAG